jgi:hypothetical protein
MLDNTTQFDWLDYHVPMRKHFKSRVPAANVSRLNEVVATDTYFSDPPAMDVGLFGHGGTTMVQLFCGCQNLITAVYPMRCEGNISAPLKISSVSMVHRILCLATILSLRLAKPSVRSCACTPSKIFNVNHTISIRILQNAVYKRL